MLKPSPSGWGPLNEEAQGHFEVLLDRCTPGPMESSGACGNFAQPTVFRKLSTISFPLVPAQESNIIMISSPSWLEGTRGNRDTD
ncbi:unnamed protein product [Lota lota]